MLAPGSHIGFLVNFFYIVLFHTNALVDDEDED